PAPALLRSPHARVAMAPRARGPVAAARPAAGMRAPASDPLAPAARAPRAIAAAAVVACATGAAWWTIAARMWLGYFPAFDLYAYFYPKALYALASLRDGGRGLL